MKHPNDQNPHRNAADSANRGNDIRTAPAAPAVTAPAVAPKPGPVVAAPAAPAPVEPSAPIKGASPGESRNT